MGNSQKTETSNAFKQLEIETVERAKLVSSVNEAAGYICKNLVKKRDLDAKSGNEAPLCNLMATALMAWAVTMQEHPMGIMNLFRDSGYENGNHV